MAITAFLSRSPGLLNRCLGAQPLWDMFLIPASSLQLQLLNWGPEGPASLGAGSLYSIESPTDLNFLSPGLYNNLTSTLLPACVTISHSVQPLDSQGHILIFLDRMHLLFTLVHFLFWHLGRVGGQYTAIMHKITIYGILLMGLVGRVFTNGLGDLGSIPGCVIPRTLKMVLDTTLLNTQQYKVCIKGKVEQSRERSCAFPYTSVL